MQTILGSGGQIANELARELARGYTTDLRLVSRHPKAVNAGDAVMQADLTDAGQTRAAAAGSDTVYFTAGLPAKTELWQSTFPGMLRNSLDAARAAGARFVYFDNTYMYPQDDRVLTEETPFEPNGPKGTVRAEMAQMVLDEMARGDIPVLIARAPEFYGPGKTVSYTHALVLNRMLGGKRALVPVNDEKRRTLIWTPDASRGLALLGNTDDAYGQTWHLPVDPARPTYRELIGMAARTFDVSRRYVVLPKWLLSAAGAFNPMAASVRELLPRYASDNIFSSKKFDERFPDFETTTVTEGLKQLAAERPVTR